MPVGGSGMKLGITTETFSPIENHEWLGSQHGTDNCDPITLDGAALLVSFPTGIVPSGVVVAKRTSTGRYEMYATAGADGLDTAAGHLFTTVDVSLAGINTSAALFWHGEVVEAKLPTGHLLDAAAKVDLKLIRYV